MSEKGAGRRLAIFYDAAYPFTDGGGQRRLYEVARHLAIQGWTVHWYALKTWDGDSVQVRDGIVYFGLKGHTKFYGPNGKRELKEALSYGFAVLTAKADFGRYDLVWCAQWPIFHIIVLIARLVPWRSTLLVDWWEVWGRYWLKYSPWLGLGGWLIEVTLTRALAWCGHLVTDSTLGKDRLAGLGIPVERVTVIPNGVDVGSLMASVPAAGTSDIVYFGRLKGHKNVDHIIQAIAILKNRDSQILRLDLIGEGPERANLEQLAHALGVFEQTLFHGRVDTDKAISLLKRSKVFVHASTQQCGGSINLLEANACGLPVVCYRHPMGIDPAEVVEGETGVMVSPAEPQFLANGISTVLKLVESDHVREHCIARVQSFDWSATAEQYHILMESLLTH